MGNLEPKCSKISTFIIEGNQLRLRLILKHIIPQGNGPPTLMLESNIKNNILTVSWETPPIHTAHPRYQFTATHPLLYITRVLLKFLLMYYIIIHILDRNDTDSDR